MTKEYKSFASLNIDIHKNILYEHNDYHLDEIDINKLIVKGYLGGSYEDLGLWDNKEDAERGIVGGERLHELLSEFDGKKVKITVEEIE